MVNSFVIGWAVFHGYAVEDYFSDWGAGAFDPRSAPRAKVGQTMLSRSAGQPDDSLEMAAAVLARRPTRFAQSVAASAPDAAADRTGLGAAHRTVAPPASGLGRQEAPSGVVPGLESASIALCAHDCPLGRATGFGAATSASSAQGWAGAASDADRRPTSQPSVDDRFQRVVSDGGRDTRRTVDRARSVQPLRFGGAVVGQPTVAASSGCDERAFPRKRDAGSDPGGQRRAICVQRAGGIVAFERVVDAAGGSGGVHAPGSSRGQRSARTVSSGAEAGDGPATGTHASGTTAPDDGVVGVLQPGAAARGVGTVSAREVLSEEWTALSAAPAARKISSGLDGATDSKQRRDSLERTTAIRRGGVRWTTCRVEATAPRGVGRVFHPFADRSSARCRCRSDAPDGVSASAARSSENQSVSDVLSSKCKRCVVTVPTLILSPRRGNHLGPVLRMTVRPIPSRDFSRRRRTILLLLGGEGRDEGERISNGRNAVPSPQRAGATRVNHGFLDS